VERLLETRQFDEIILSTLPQHVSKWLRVDLPTGCTATRAAGDDHHRQPREVKLPTSKGRRDGTD
jgi:hypothetical protein